MESVAGLNRNQWPLWIGISGRFASECACRRVFADSTLEFRIGINLGDIIDDGQDIHGEGVNVAARIETLADAGGISISGGVYDQVRNRIEAIYEDRGEHEVKNVSAAVRVYAIRLKVDERSLVPREFLEISERPAVAVLPFDNLSGDPEQEYFSDGLTEDLITALSAFRWFPVIARNSSYAYKGKSLDIRQVAEELGVRYIVEGSVRKAGTSVRVAAQLIDGATGHHVWAENLDRELEDVFELQDELTRRIAAIVMPELERVETNRLPISGVGNMNAWELVQRGWSQLYDSPTEGCAEVRTLFTQAIELDPSNSRAYSGIGYSHFMDALMGAVDQRDLKLEEIIACAGPCLQSKETHYI